MQRLDPRGWANRQFQSRNYTGKRRRRRVAREMDALFLNRDGRVGETAAQRDGRVVGCIGWLGRRPAATGYHQALHEAFVVLRSIQHAFLRS